MPKVVIESMPFGDPLESRIEAIKEAIEVIHGERGTRIAKLDVNTATVADVAAKINEIITLLQGS